MGKVKRDRCAYCQETDTAEYTLWSCPRWEAQRSRVHIEFSHTLTPEGMIGNILKDEVTWMVIQNFVKYVLRKKKRKERLMQGA